MPIDANPPASEIPDSLLTGENAGFIDQEYQRWLEDPTVVDPAWSALFASWGPGAADGSGARRPGSGPRMRPRSIFNPGVARGVAAPADVMAAAQRQARVAQLINAYRVRGHTEADIDPLGRREVHPHPELTLSYYGLTDADLDVPVSGRPCVAVPEITTLRHLIQRLRKAYCGGFGVEFMNIGDPAKKAWLQQRIETLQDRDVLDREGERHVLRLLADAENFEATLHTRFPGTKRFSLEGAETLIPLMDMLLDAVGQRGVDEVIIGMAHRGRLNVLANILEKPVGQIVDEFMGASNVGTGGSGDVKYHLGYTSEYRSVHGGHKVLLSLAFNPSHLEAVDPVVEGRARARQDRRGRGQVAAASVMPMLLHGDAAFAGQGIVCETLNLSDLSGYRTGGTVHVIVNNQIGFTTSPKNARSTPYCTDVARMLAVPIFHVNGEDVEAVAAVAQLAGEWRQTFHQDVIIDLYCYRKHGHNEGDEPSFTQPLLYDAIRSHPSPRVVYAQKMVDERGDLTRAEVDSIIGDSVARLEALLRSSPPEQTLESNPLRAAVARLWDGYKGSVHDPVDTSFPMDRLVALLKLVNAVPEDFHAHPKIRRLLSARLRQVHGDRPVDWAVAEQAAFASLVDTGHRVRLSGQDCGRGTFSHRHALLTDIETGADYIPLQHVASDQGRFQVFDSMLSEAAVLGFEYGYSLESPDTLVIWEAQFGDFANGAQVIIDNFIMTGEQKWDRCSGVVMLLPHGYEGQGPEHSSARLERYLQGCAQHNIMVANCTTPASFFHLLRRQALMKVRKPLVVMSPKSLLRHPDCVSTLAELSDGSFARVIPESADEIAADGVKRVVFCSGKIYYDLRRARAERGVRNVALVRLEQLYPFPAEEVRAVLATYADPLEVVWCQEEPRNMGAWPMMDEWMGEVLGGIPPRYVGRPASASTATGYSHQHKAEHSALIDEALRV